MQKLYGVVVPIVTPLTDRDTADEASICRLVDHCLEGGLQLFVLTYGQASVIEGVFIFIGEDYLHIGNNSSLSSQIAALRGEICLLRNVNSTAVHESEAHLTSALARGGLTHCDSSSELAELGRKELCRTVTVIIDEDCHGHINAVFIGSSYRLIALSVAGNEYLSLRQQVVQ